MNFIDRTLRVLSPKLALRRARNLAMADAYQRSGRSRGYDAASKSRRTAGWNTTSGSADAEITYKAALLRDRARDSVRNNTWARKSAKVIRTNVAGKGIKLALQGASEATVDRAKSIWAAWAESKNCDFYGKKNFYGLQRQIVNAVFVDGEVLVRQHRATKDVRGRDLDVKMQLQVLEIDFLDTTVSRLLGDGREVKNGIEIDKHGRPVAYYLYERHPGGIDYHRNVKSSRVSISELLHIFYEERPGQTRGATDLSASMVRLKDLDDYSDAQVVKQKISACFTGMVEGSGEARPGEDDDYFQLERVEPGMIDYLKPGEKITFSSPPESKEFGDFIRANMQAVSAGVGLTYESVTNDLSNVNFSSGRMGWVEMSRIIAEWQDDIVISQFCEDVWGWFIAAAQVSRVIGKDVEKLRTSWTPPRREMLDPVKETKGMQDKVRAGFVAYQDAVRELGSDPDVVLAKHMEDRRNFDRMDAMFTVDPRYDPQRTEQSEGTEGDTE